jgi:hypothetical protein
MNAPFMTRKLVSDFIKKNRRSPNEEEYKLLQWEATRIIIKNNSVYGIKPITEEEISKIQRKMEMSIFDRYGIKKGDFENEKIQN